MALNFVIILEILRGTSFVLIGIIYTQRQTHIDRETNRGVGGGEGVWLTNCLLYFILSPFL